MLYSFQRAKNGLLSGGIDKWIPGIETIKLEINYRSHDEIIAKSQKLISHNYSDLGGPYPQEFMKNTSGIKGPGGMVQFQMYSDAEQEALEVANTINELIQADYAPGDFFIGARTRAQLGYAEGALVRADIPFINIAGGSFWQSRHVADVIGYFRLAHDTSDKVALKRVYNIPSASHQYTWNDAKCKKCKGRGPDGCPACNGLGFIEKDAKFQAGDYCPTRYLGEEFLKRIDFDFNKIDKILLGEDGWRYQTKKKDYTKHGPTKAQDLQEFVWMLQHILNQADNVGQVIRVIIDDCYEKYLKAQGMGDDGLSNAKLEDLATVEEIASRYASADKFLAYVDEMVEAAEKAKNKEWEGYAVLSTYHGLKGLERPIVFGLGWSEGKCQKTGKNVGLLPHTFSLSPPPNFGVLPGGGMSPVEDERCIGFVCVSRAIERVYLSGIENYRSWIMGPSRFVHEMELAK
jgi:DNA helicase-2/ATP-dependent DNA helicase PcrA